MLRFRRPGKLSPPAAASARRPELTTAGLATEQLMAKSLDTLLSNLRGPTADREFIVQPFDNRYEAIVTIYEPIRATFRAVESSAREALLEALLLADREA